MSNRALAALLLLVRSGRLPSGAASSPASRRPTATSRRSSATPSRPKTSAIGSARPSRSSSLRESGPACRSPTSAPARAITRSGWRRSSGERGRVLAEDIVPEGRGAAGPARPPREPRQCRGQARRAGRSQAAAQFVRPHLSRPHVSRGGIALRLHVAPAPRAEAGWRGHRGGCRPGAEAARDAAAPSCNASWPRWA